MKTVKFILISVLVMASAYVTAQEIECKWISGSLSFLKETQNIKIVYDYSDLMVGEMKESDYIARRMKEEDNKNPGDGEIWLKEWKDDRGVYYEPKFEELWNKYMPRVRCGKNLESDVIMNVHTTWIEPGFNAPMTFYGNRDAFINANITFTRSGNETAVFKITNSPGCCSYHTAERIGESYAKAAKTLASYARDLIKK